MEKSRNYVCRCEEVTEEDIEEAIKNGATTLNEIKRWTRAGMGLCQGKICSKNVARILSKKTGQDPGILEPSTYRKPVRPVRIEALSKKEGGNDNENLG
jgi:bacterioferritin-associated ferredoxin